MAIIVQKVSLDGITAEITRDTVKNIFTIVVRTNPSNLTCTLDIWDEDTRTISQSWPLGAALSRTEVNIESLAIPIPARYSFRLGCS